MADRPPNGLGPGGRALWRAISSEHELDATQRVLLTEACRAKDRLDKLDQLLRGEIDVWARVEVDGELAADLVVDRALDKANATATVMKQLLTTLRLPDEA